MKLTKGKITKLYKNKNKKQTLKKKVNKKNTKSNSKTFRRKRKVNLARKSLKKFNYNGGDAPVSPKTPDFETNENETMDSDTIVKDVELADKRELNDMGEKENVIIDERVKEAENALASTEEEKKPIQLNDNIVPEKESEPQNVVDIIEPTEQTKSQEENNEFVVTETPVAEEDTEGNITPRPDKESNEDKKDEAVSQPEVQQEDINEGKEGEIPIEPPVVEEVAETSSLPKAFDEVVDFLTDKVAERVKQDMNEGAQQNGFESVNNASETMANKGGAKKGTRKFRLVKNRRQ